MLVVFVFVGTAALCALAVLGATLRLVPEHEICPHCAEPPLRLVTHALLRSLGLERRWCFVCGWSGLSKRTTCAAADPPVVQTERPAKPVEGDGDGWRPLTGDDGWRPKGGG